MDTKAQRVARIGNDVSLPPLGEAIATAFGAALAEQKRRSADRALSREMVDSAIRRMSGEPFADAIAYVLRAASETTILSPVEIEATIAACRAWEERRSEVAPGRRELSRDDSLRCCAAVERAWRKACPESPMGVGVWATFEHYETGRRVA